jgi:hypothetical protein
MNNNIADIIYHYHISCQNYDIIGESHLEYYKNKYPENYLKLKEYERNNRIKRTVS